jgi:hypothetical protein
MNGLMRGLRGAVLLGAGIAITGCSQLGSLGNVLGGVLSPAGSGTGTVQGTVRGIDTQRGILQITTDQGQTGNVYFDNRTQVVFNQQTYPVTALEQGDRVNLQIQQDQNGNYYASYIQVTQDVRQGSGGYNNGGYNNGGYNNDNSRYGTTNGSLQIEGRVSWVNNQNGQFGLNSNRGQFTVIMPYNPASNDVNVFRNMRQNDYVRVQGQQTGNGTIQLTRFY